MRALVIQGGGTRAAYANGVLAALEEAGHGDFDAVYGTSAGGALAGWFTAGQARYAIDTWDYVEDPRILSWGRFLTLQGPLLDHDGLFDIVYSDEMPLDVEAVRSAPHPVIVPATNAETGGTDYLDVRREPVLHRIMATGRLPLASGGPVEIDGVPYVDGGITDPVPLERAIDDGADDVLLVLNRPRGVRSPESKLAIALVARRYPALKEPLEAHHRFHNRVMEILDEPPGGVRVDVVRPEQPLPVGRLTGDASRVRRAIDVGVQDGRGWLADRGPDHRNASAARIVAGDRRSDGSVAG